MESRAKSRRYLLPAVVLAVVAVLVIWMKTPPPSGILHPADNHEAQPTPPRPGHSPAGKNEEPAGVPAPEQSAAPDAAVALLIRKSLENFRNNHDPEQARIHFRQLRDALREAPEEGAAAAVADFLKTGEDAATGLPFVVGPDGMMETVPTFRLALLDLLPSLDPVASLELARELMDRQTSPDEYALSLRNLAWNDLDGDLRDELSRRFLALLKTPWLARPSAGFLESFDIPVEVGGSAMFDSLVSLARDATAQSNTAASQAAFTSLDRMIVRDRTLLTKALSSDAAWMGFAPQQRASLLSRLDITQAEQRELFLRYLSATSHPAGELDYFAKIFPNENFLYGHRLVTADEATPSIAEVTQADARVLGELDALAPSVSGEALAAVDQIRARLAKSSVRQSK